MVSGEDLGPAFFFSLALAFLPCDFYVFTICKIYEVTIFSALAFPHIFEEVNASI